MHGSLLRKKVIDIWKDIPGYEGRYQIDNDGKVKSLARTIVSKNGQVHTIQEHILRPNKIKNGYLVVHLSKNNVRTAYYIHLLVANQFLPNPNKLPVVNHKDGNKTRRCVENLEWSTYSDNNQHAYDTGLKPRGEGQYKARLTKTNVIEIRKLGKYDTFENIASKYGVSKATIRDVLLFRTWKHVI